jgi:hypothetical protein
VRAGFVAALVAFVLVAPARAQVAPLRTADPIPLPHGELSVHVGVDVLGDVEFPLSGLRGDLAHLPAVGLRLGMGGIGELQVGTGFQLLHVRSRTAAPLDTMLGAVGDFTTDVDDPYVAVKIRLDEETKYRPATGLRMVTRLPSSGQESGLGNDTIDFLTYILAAKSVGRTRLLANLGLGILSTPLRGDRQNDVIVYGLAASRPLSERWLLVGEVNGRRDVTGDTPIGTEDRSEARLGARWSRPPVVLYGAVLAGLHRGDPDVGGIFGVNWSRRAYR